MASQTLQDLRRRRAEILTVAAAYDVTNIRVFGSVARGTDTRASDIDLLVDFDVESLGLGPLAGFRADVEVLLGRPVDIATVSLLRDDIREGVVAEAVPL